VPRPQHPAGASRHRTAVAPRAADGRSLKATAHAPANDHEKNMPACTANDLDANRRRIRQTFQRRIVMHAELRAAEVRVPTGGDAAQVTADGATLDHIEGDPAVYRVQPGSYVFIAHAGPGPQCRPRLSS
jgi:hypothetical protein